jgi:hypothetical protein
MMMKLTKLCGSVICLAAVGCGSGDDAEPGASDGVLRDSLGQELSAISAAIVRANLDAEVDATLLARIQVQADEFVDFHELEPGIVAISGSGRPSSAPIGEAMTEAQPTTRAAWAALSRNAAMPSLLAEAIEREEAAALLPRPAADESEPAPEPAASAPTADARAAHLPVEGAAHLSSAWCDDEYYSAVVGAFSLILDNPQESILGACLSPRVYPDVECFDHITGDWTASARGSWQKANVCPYRGDLTWTLRVKGKERVKRTVLENTAHWAKVIDRASTSTMTVILNNAAGDGYQFRFFGG